MSEQQIEPGAQEGVMTPAEVHAETIADPATPAVQAETMSEPASIAAPAPSKTVAIALGTGVVVNVPMQSEWRMSAQNYMRVGDFDSWAEVVLSKVDLAAWDEWMDKDPTMGEMTPFFEALGKATGEAAAGNRALRRQLQRTQRR